MRIVVFGAGIAGLTAAHYLSQRGHKVLVVEQFGLAGGLARSERTSKNLPIEYSWRGFGPWYHNAYALLKEIGVYDNLEPIHFNMFDSSRWGAWDKVKLAWLAAKTWTACPERQAHYAATPAYQSLQVVSPGVAHDAAWVLGPWVGSDIGKISTHHAGHFFMHNLFPGQTHRWENFEQGSGSPWLVTTKPTNEAWFDPWVKRMKQRGVKFYWNTRVLRFVDGIAQLDDGRRLKADHFVLAINPFMADKVLRDSMGAPQLDARFLSEHHRQISFRVIFFEPISMPPNSAWILLQSPFDLTFYTQQPSFLQDWYSALWSGTACIDSIPGLLGVPMRSVTKPQLLWELRQQLLGSTELQALVQSRNGKPLEAFQFEIKVWPTWEFPPEHSTVEDPKQPKWVNDWHNRPYQPVAKLDKIVLAGAHMKTNADLYSMEAAVESGKRAADLITHQTTVIPQHVPVPIRMLRHIDVGLWACHLPNVVTVLIVLSIVVLLYCVKVKFSKQR